ncbi:ATP phosphoribosyltransferase, chloroplastic isoform X2 [Elaeis guineensis]|uniref:ATP phosphoribosyltransferase, chloroplastic isoform X2 n=1 Tax=Elaeis guineensis var. tenera TaxID=51953 RepID=UPI003C6D9C13
MTAFRIFLADTEQAPSRSSATSDPRRTEGSSSSIFFPGPFPFLGKKILEARKRGGKRRRWPPPSILVPFSTSGPPLPPPLGPSPGPTSLRSGAARPLPLRGDPEALPLERTVVRLGLPSKGRMADETLSLLKNCQLSVRQVNPRQYVADMPQLSNLEVWFQRPKDIVRKLRSGDLDIGIVGFDTVSEYGQGNEDLVVVHDALEYGACRLSLAIPKYGIFENINTLHELAQMPQWTAERPLRIVTGFSYLGPKFLKEKGLDHVSFSTADGALEAAPAMGIADAIIDLVSSGTTLHENDLKEIEGGVVLESQAVFVASRRSLNIREGVLEITHEILERLEAHLRATGQVTMVANMRGNSAKEVAERILSQTSLSGLQAGLLFLGQRRSQLSHEIC